MNNTLGSWARKHFLLARGPGLPRLAHAIALIGLLITRGGTADPSLHVDWKDGCLTVTATAMTRARILAAVSERTGLEVRGSGGLDEILSVHVIGLPLAAALRQVLMGLRAYALVEEPTSDGTTSRPVLILPGATVQGTPPAPSGPPLDEVGTLAAAITQGDAEVTQATAEELLQGPARVGAIKLLGETARSGNRSARLRALHLLYENRRGDEPAVLSALGHAVVEGDGDMKEYALRGLARIGTPESLVYLRNALSDPEPTVRLKAVEALAQMELGRPLLQEAVHDRDAAVRAFAAFWLNQDTGGDSDGSVSETRDGRFVPVEADSYIHDPPP